MWCSKAYICRGAGGIQPKGADSIIIHNCIVERTNLVGIGVGFDPFWCSLLRSVPCTDDACLDALPASALGCASSDHVQ